MSMYDQELADIMQIEHAKRARNRRCRAHVSPASLLIRSRHSPTDPRCLRLAKIKGMCLQHAAAPCQASGCRRASVQQEGNWRFCRKHAPIWRVHNEIVDRILAIQVRRD